MIMDSLNIKYDVVDVTEPGNEKDKEQMQAVCKRRDPQKSPSPPQFFNDDIYCGVS